MSLQRHLRDDRGITLAELMVTVLIVSMVGVGVSTVMVSSLEMTRNIEGAARSNDDVRLVLATMDREIKSASQVCHPEPAFSSNQIVFETKAGTGATQKISYYLSDPDADGIGDLIRWEDGQTRVVVDDVLNGFVSVRDGTDELIFTHQGVEEVGGTTIPGSPAQGRVVYVRIWIDANPRDDISPKLETVELNGRNIWNPNAGCD
ncbi:MAG: type IV pilus modification PilV family protein [Acidimicrobiia bacterium]